MQTYYFVNSDRLGIPGFGIIAQNASQAKHYLRKAPAYCYVGTHPPCDTWEHMWHGVNLVGDLRRGYDSLKANGASGDTLKVFRRDWRFTPSIKE